MIRGTRQVVIVQLWLLRRICIIGRDSHCRPKRTTHQSAGSPFLVSGEYYYSSLNN